MTPPASSSTSQIPAPPAGLQFSVWDLGCFLVACAAFFGWLRFLFHRVDSGRIPAFEHPAFQIALLYLPFPLAVVGLLPRRTSSLFEAAPGLSGHALWRVSALLYPAAYLLATVLASPGEGLWTLALGAAGATTLWFAIAGALMLWECSASRAPKTRSYRVGLALYLYGLFALPVSILVALLGRTP